MGAEIVSALGASCAAVLVARNTTLDSNAGSDLEVRGRVRPKGSDDASCFMAQTHGVLERKGSVCTLRVVVY